MIDLGVLEIDESFIVYMTYAILRHVKYGVIYWLHNARLWGVYKLEIFKHAIVGISVSNEWWLGIKQGHSDVTFVWLLKVDLFWIVLPDKKHRFE